jgi:anion-transporting  ArsA/GET3 family ATPase
MARRAAAESNLLDLLAAKEMVLVCGSGGTGKTTVSAALGLAAATRLGARVLVLTVDPARRLGTALGLGEVGSDEVRVPHEVIAELDPDAHPNGELWVAMLDTKAGWDELIRRHAPDAGVRDTVLANPLYRNITGRFVNSHDYLAMERLHDVHASGRYDLVVIDTPPSRNALDLLDAPGRMKEFFGSRLLRWLTVPYRSRLFTVASKPFYQVADRVLGSRFLQDIAEFFVLFQTMERGFVRRADEVERLLTDPRSAFVVVSTLEAAPVHEALFLVRALHDRSMPLGAMVLNRTLPTELRRPALAKAARAVAAADEASVSSTVGTPADATAAVLGEVGERFHDVAVVASREAERRAELVDRAPAVAVATVPSLTRDVTDLTALADIARHLLT